MWSRRQPRTRVGEYILRVAQVSKFLPWIGCKESRIKNSASRPLAQVLGNRPVCPQFLPVSRPRFSSPVSPSTYAGKTGFAQRAAGRYGLAELALLLQRFNSQVCTIWSLECRYWAYHKGVRVRYLSHPLFAFFSVAVALFVIVTKPVLTVVFALFALSVFCFLLVDVPGVSPCLTRGVRKALPIFAFPVFSPRPPPAA